jgi:predicted secreted protein
LVTLGLTLKLLSADQVLPQPVIQTKNPAPINAGVQQENSMGAATPQPSFASSQIGIDMQTAIQTAQADAGIAVLTNSNPELVNLDGKVAYEVSFDLGKIYIDANNGIILSNSIAITPQMAAQVASQYLQMGQVSQVETVILKGENFYKVSFTAGMNAYINRKGQISYIENSNSVPTLNNNDEKDD